MIDVISVNLQERARLEGKADPVVRGAQTGIAAFNIRGRTIHSLRLPVRNAFEPLSPTSLTGLQERLRACRFLILDEKPMIGLGTNHPPHRSKASSSLSGCAGSMVWRADCSFVWGFLPAPSGDGEGVVLCR
jgi:hypothetical protein